MISLHSTGSPAETSAAYTLLAIIADPAAAKKRLDEIVAEKKTSLEAMENARKLTEEASQTHSDATAKLAEAKRVSDAFNADHQVRIKQLDERHEFLVAKDARLTTYEAKVAAREKALGEPLAARERDISAREAKIEKREAAVSEAVANAQAVKDSYERKIAALHAVVSK